MSGRRRSSETRFLSYFILICITITIIAFATGHPEIIIIGGVAAGLIIWAMVAY